MSTTKNVHWYCSSCGTDAYAEIPPNFGWTDGHRCRFRLVKEEEIEDHSPLQYDDLD